MIYLVGQAEKASWNSIGIFKLSNISGKRRNLLPTPSADDASDADGESSSDEEDDNNGSMSDLPVLQARFAFQHYLRKFCVLMYNCKIRLTSYL